MPENVRRSNRKRERHQNPASSPTNLSGGNYHHLPVLDIVLKNIKNQYSGAKPSGACSLGIAGIRALSEGNYHHLPVLDIVLKNIKNQYPGDVLFGTCPLCIGALIKYNKGLKTNITPHVS
ncbi:MAG: hypothetical protein IJO35_01550 [Methanocorpusculum sp.]|nr:hypothetical protein [Methanocorpusculum sp.]